MRAFSARAILLPSLLVLVGMTFMTIRAVPRIPDGSQDLRTVFHVMNDETVILERVWMMVDRGDLHHSIPVYPGFYPYVVAIVKLCSSSDSVAEVVENTRWLSLVTMWIALLVPFALLGILAESWWVAAIFTFFLSIHPETVLWSSRVHPDAFLTLFNHAAVACFGLALAKDRRFLWAATVFSALSAGTKLVGCFIMASIAVFILWDHRRNWREMLRQLSLHTLLFFAVFALTTPMFVLYPVETVDGFVIQNKRNRAPSAKPIDWWPTFIGDRGLGWSGVLAVLLGMVLFAYRSIRARAIDGVGLIALFGLFYLVYILVAVRLTLPRYAAPAMFPLLFVAMYQLRPQAFPKKAISLVACTALAATYFAFDWTNQLQALAQEDDRLERTLTPERVALGRRLEEISRERPGEIVSSVTAWVPEGVPWYYIWSLDEISVPGDYAAIAVDRTLAKGKTYEKLKKGELPYGATATIGEYVVYEPLTRQDSGSDPSDR